MGDDTPRHLGHFIAVSFYMFVLLASLLIPTLAFAQSQTVGEQFPQSIVASSSTGTTPNYHVIKLRAVQQLGNEAQQVIGFNLDVTNTVSAQINSQLNVFVSDSSLRVIEAKVKTISDQFIDLVPSSSPQANNSFSLANLPVGVYTLDVITQKGNTKAAYEGFLVIGNQPTTILDETTRQIIFREINEGGEPPFLPPPPPESGIVENGDDDGVDDDGVDDDGVDDDGVDDDEVDDDEVDDDEGDDDEGDDDEGDDDEEV